MSVTTTVKLDLDRSGAFATNISQYLISADVRQGRKKSLDPMEPATATVVLNNADGRFSPDNGSSPYSPDWDENYRGIQIAAGTRYFTGYIIRIQQDPFIENQQITLNCVDRLGLLALQNISCGLFRQQPLHLILNRVLDCLEKGEEITNPGGEGGLTTHYAATQSAIISAVNTISFEGDYCIQAVCDGSLTQQGWVYDLGANQTTYKTIALLARLAPGDGSATLTLRGFAYPATEVWTDTINVVDDAWTYKRTIERTGHRYILLQTQAAVALTILSDGLHQIPDTSQIYRSVPTSLDAEVELFGLYNQPALENLNRLLATEAAGFLYMRFDGTLYGTAFASAQVVRDTKTSPSATFGDDGTNVPYVGLKYDLDAQERVSQVEVKSEGIYQDENEEATVWQLSPTGFLIPATESIVIHAKYSQPARNCSLVVETNVPGGFPIAQEADDATLRKDDSGTPYEMVGCYLHVGMWILGAVKCRARVFLRFDTSGIPDGATLQNAWLNIWLKANYSDMDFIIRLRDAPGWYPISSDDWTKGDGNPLLGSYNTANLPPAEQRIAIPIDISGIDKAGWTELRLASSRDEDAATPTGSEYVAFYNYGFGGNNKRPILSVKYEGGAFATAAMVNYGVGAKIMLTAGSLDAIVPDVSITGYPLQACSEESTVIKEATSPPPIPRTLSVEMPFQSTRTSDMVAEGNRLATRYSGKVRRLPLALQDEDAASLAQMQDRQLDDLVRIINTKFGFSTKIDDLFFVEGMNWRVSEQGKVLEMLYDLEEK
jgi:hypothetical protein